MGKQAILVIPINDGRSFPDGPTGSIGMYPIIRETLGKCDVCLKWDGGRTICTDGYASPLKCGADFEPAGQIEAANPKENGGKGELLSMTVIDKKSIPTSVAKSDLPYPLVSPGPIASDRTAELLAKSSYNEALRQEDPRKKALTAINYAVAARLRDVGKWRTLMKAAEQYNIGVTLEMLESAGLKRSEIIEVLHAVDPEFKKSDSPDMILQKAMAAGHKYWKRDGAPGNYRYYYHDEAGNKQYSPEPWRGQLKSLTHERTEHPSVLHGWDNKGSGGYNEWFDKHPDAPKSAAVAVRHTKSGHPVSEAQQDRQAQAAQEHAYRQHDKVEPRYGEPEPDKAEKYRRHKSAADAAVQAAWHAHHAGNEIDSDDMMSYADHHGTEAMKHAKALGGEHEKDYDDDYRWHGRMHEAAKLTGHTGDPGSYFHPTHLAHVEKVHMVPKSKRPTVKDEAKQKYGKMGNSGGPHKVWDDAVRRAYSHQGFEPSSKAKSPQQYKLRKQAADDSASAAVHSWKIGDKQMHSKMSAMAETHAAAAGEIANRLGGKHKKDFDQDSRWHQNQAAALNISKQRKDEPIAKSSPLLDFLNAQAARVAAVGKRDGIKDAGKLADVLSKSISSVVAGKRLENVQRAIRELNLTRGDLQKMIEAHLGE